MRVLWFSNTTASAAQLLGVSSPGGAWISSLEQALAQSGELTLGVAFFYKSKKIECIESSDTRYYTIPNWRNKLTKYKDRFYVNPFSQKDIDHFLQIIDEFKPDVIQVWGTEGPFGLIGRYTNIPVVIHIQGNLHVYHHKWYSGVGWYDVFRSLTLKNVLKGNNFLVYKAHMKRNVKREAVIFQTNQHFIGRTIWDRRVVKALSNEAAYYHCDEVMRPGFYTALWQPKYPAENFVISTVILGALYKGLETVLGTAILLKHKGFSFTWRINGIAPGDDYVRMVERKLRVRCADYQVRLLGYSTEERLIDELQKTDLLVHPTHIENGCNAVGEAMLMGIPVLSTAAGGLMTTIKDTSDGYLVQDGDPYAMAGAILEIAGNYPEACELAKRGQQTARNRHSISAITATLKNIYQSILQA